jgi:hypothetical protein
MVQMVQQKVMTVVMVMVVTAEMVANNGFP